jgi:hypothetical protein
LERFDFLGHKSHAHLNGAVDRARELFVVRRACAKAGGDFANEWIARVAVAPFLKEARRLPSVLDEHARRYGWLAVRTGHAAEADHASADRARVSE